jgi:hypothetical protein
LRGNVGIFVWSDLALPVNVCAEPDNNLISVQKNHAHDQSDWRALFCCNALNETTHGLAEARSQFGHSQAAPVFALATEQCAPVQANVRDLLTTSVIRRFKLGDIDRRDFARRWRRVFRAQSSSP